MNGMELNVNYSILFLYTCGLAYYSLSSSLSLSSLLASTSVGEMVKLRGKGRLGGQEGVGNAIRDLGVCPLKKNKVTKWLMSLQVGVDIANLTATVQIEY